MVKVNSSQFFTPEDKPKTQKLKQDNNDIEVWDYGKYTEGNKPLPNPYVLNNIENFAYAKGYKIVFEDDPKTKENEAAVQKQTFASSLVKEFTTSKYDKNNDNIMQESELLAFLEGKVNIPTGTGFKVIKEDVNVIANEAVNVSVKEEGVAQEKVSNFYVKVSEGAKQQLSKTLTAKGLDVSGLGDYEMYMMLNLLNSKYRDVDKTGNHKEISDVEITKFVKDVKNGDVSVKRQGVTDALYGLAEGKTVTVEDIETPEGKMVNPLKAGATSIINSLNEQIKKSDEYVKGIQEEKAKLENEVEKHIKDIKGFEENIKKGKIKEFKAFAQKYIELDSKIKIRTDDNEKQTIKKEQKEIRTQVEKQKLLKNSKTNTSALLRKYGNADIKFLKATKDKTKIEQKLEVAITDAEKDKAILNEQVKVISSINEKGGVSNFDELKTIYNYKVELNRDGGTELNYNFDATTKDMLYQKLCFSGTNPPVYDQLATNKINALTGYSGTMIRQEEGGAFVFRAYPPQNLLKPNMPNLTIDDLNFGFKVVEDYSKSNMLSQKTNELKVNNEPAKDELKFNNKEDLALDNSKYVFSHFKLEPTAYVLEPITTKADEIAPKLEEYYYMDK